MSSQYSGTYTAPATQTSKTLSSDVVEVWSDNFITEIDKLQKLVVDYPYIAMDTEFPGDVYEDDGNHYGMLA